MLRSSICWPHRISFFEIQCRILCVEPRVVTGVCDGRRVGCGFAERNVHTPEVYDVAHASGIDRAAVDGFAAAQKQQQCLSPRDQLAAIVMYLCRGIDLIPPDVHERPPPPHPDGFHKTAEYERQVAAFGNSQFPADPPDPWRHVMSRD